MWKMCIRDSFTGQVSSAYGIVDKGCHSTDTKMLEFHLVPVYACGTNLLVTFHNDTVIRFVIEIGIDEITNLGAVKIRIRSLLAALEND